MEHDPYAALLDRITDELEDLTGRQPFPTLAPMLEQRARALPVGHVERASWFSHAGEAWAMSHDLERARVCHELAVADGGPCWIDPRVPLVGVLLQQGDMGRADDLLRELRHDGVTKQLRGPVHGFVGESLETAGRLQEALRWFNAGLTRAEDEAPDVGLLNGHYRVRRALGMPLDRFDTICEESRRKAKAEFDEEDWDEEDWDEEDWDDWDDSRDRLEATPRLTVLYWPPDEFEQALDRWPSMRDTHGADHAEHRSIVERHLRELSGRGAQVVLGPATTDGYIEYAAEQGEDPAESATRAAYAAHLGIIGTTVPWPPGRNDPCWCGSGAKYKKCCGALRFAASAPDPG